MGFQQSLRSIWRLNLDALSDQVNDSELASYITSKQSKQINNVNLAIPSCVFASRPSRAGMASIVEGIPEFLSALPRCVGTASVVGGVAPTERGHVTMDQVQALLTAIILYMGGWLADASKKIKIGEKLMNLPLGLRCRVSASRGQL